VHRLVRFVCLSGSRWAVKSHGVLFGDTSGFLMESCWRGAFFLLAAGLVYLMNTNGVELRSVGDPCSAMVGQRHIFALLAFICSQDVLAHRSALVRLLGLYHGHHSQWFAWSEAAQFFVRTSAINDTGPLARRVPEAKRPSTRRASG